MLSLRTLHGMHTTAPKKTPDAGAPHTLHKRTLAGVVDSGSRLGTSFKICMPANAILLYQRQDQAKTKWKIFLTITNAYAKTERSKFRSEINLYIIWATDICEWKLYLHCCHTAQKHYFITNLQSVWKYMSNFKTSFMFTEALSSINLLKNSCELKQGLSTFNL